MGAWVSLIVVVLSFLAGFGVLAVMLIFLVFS